MKNKKAIMAKWLIGIILIIAALGVVLLFISELQPALETKAEQGIIQPIKSLTLGENPSLLDSSAVIVYKESKHGLRFSGWNGVEWTDWIGDPLEKKNEVKYLNRSGISLVTFNEDMDDASEMLLVYKKSERFYYRIWDNDFWSSKKKFSSKDEGHAENAIKLEPADTDGDGVDDTVYAAYCTSTFDNKNSMITYHLYYNIFKDGSWQVNTNQRWIDDVGTIHAMFFGFGCKSLELVAADLDGDNKQESVLLFYDIISGTGPFFNRDIWYRIYEDGKWFPKKKLASNIIKVVATSGNFDDDENEEVLVAYRNGSQILSRTYEYDSETETTNWSESVQIYKDDNIRAPLILASGNLDSSTSTDEALLVFGNKSGDNEYNLRYILYNGTNWVGKPKHIKRTNTDEVEDAAMVAGNFDDDNAEEIMLVHLASYNGAHGIDYDIYGRIFNYGKGWTKRGKCSKGSEYCIERSDATDALALTYKSVSK